ncbi:hypothetical protein BDV18DRAFT_134077 [Aspergillus unguis]
MRNSFASKPITLQIQANHYWAWGFAAPAYRASISTGKLWTAHYICLVCLMPVPPLTAGIVFGY